jgi:quinol monooxygenase YgiN
MTFHPEKVGDFLTIFQQASPKIKSFQGCEYLELLQDLSDKNIYYTYSQWKSAEDLEKYRNSPLFKATWQQTKSLFLRSPLAFSLVSCQVV